MNKWQWKLFSIATILALALAMCPPAAVNAAGGATITGIIAMAQPSNNPGANFFVDAYPVGGGDGQCGSNGPVSYVPGAPGHYAYTLNNCDDSKDYTVTAQGSGYTFNSVTVHSGDFVSFTATAPVITPVARFLSGKVTKSDGTTPWGDFVMHYELDGAPLTATTDHTTGVFTISSVSHAYTNNPAPGSGVELDMSDTSGFSAGNYVTVSSSAGSEIAGITAVNANTSITVDVLTKDHTTSSPLVTLQVNDATVLHFPQINMDGYDFRGGDRWITSPWTHDITDVYWTWTPRGTRSIHGHIESQNSNQGCTAGVTVTASASGSGALSQSFITNGDGSFHLDNLEPLSTYTLTPSRAGCVFVPASMPINVTNGNLNQDLVFKIPGTGVWGHVKTTLGDDVSLAYYLIATYTTLDGVSYSTSVNWADGSYFLPVPPNAGGALAISRVGGPAAFGYNSSGASQTGITIADQWLEYNFTLSPNRIVSGTIVGQNGVPVQKNTTVEFGYGLKLRPSTPVTAYSILAQPKLYYLSPVESGIISSTPVRFLANLTTAPSVTNANFTLNLKTYVLDGCLRRDSNDSIVLPANSVRFRPAAGYGTVTYPAALTVDGCGANNVYYKVMLPEGIVGALEADNHTLQNNTIDGMNWDNRIDMSISGMRAITGRIYTPNLNLNINGDFSGNGLLVLRDAATNDVIQTGGDLQRSFEFSIPTLEAKAYTLNINQSQIPNGYDAQPFPMSPIVTANLTAGDVDIPAASGFVLVHKPINPIFPSGGGYFVGNGGGEYMAWGGSDMNNNDRVKGFEVQMGLATTPFTDTSPTPVFSQDWNGYFFNGLTLGQLYRVRARAVFDTDKGPWLGTAPLPKSPANNAAVLPGAAAGTVTFGWDKIVPAIGGVSWILNGINVGDTMLVMDAPNHHTDGFSANDFVMVSTPAGKEINQIASIDPNVSITLKNALTLEASSKALLTVIADPSVPTNLRYVVQYSDNTAFSAVAPAVAVTLSATTATTIASNLLVNGKTYYWRVKAQNSAGVDISDWSPTQTFFNRYQNISAGPTWVQDTFDGWNPEPIHFLATSINASLPPNAYYQVQFTTAPTFPDSGPGFTVWTFTKTANITTPSARQYLNGLPNGAYHWRIRIVNGNDSNYATPITGWTNGPVDFTVP